MKVKKIILLAIIFVFIIQVRAQSSQKKKDDSPLSADTLIRNGGYLGYNVYVKNPLTFIGTDTFWTAQKVFVNDSLIFSEHQLKLEAFEIPLTNLNLQLGDSITIKIVQNQYNRVYFLYPLNWTPKSKD